MLREVDFYGEDFASEDFDVKAIVADFETRMSLFYADFKDRNSILDPPDVDRPLLEKALDDFLTFMRNQIF